jgi:hypothetical protein
VLDKRTSESNTRASLELGISQSTVWRIIHKGLKCKPSRPPLHQYLGDTDEVVRLECCIGMQERFEVEGFADSLMFKNDVAVHQSGKLNRHSTRIRETENRLAVIQHVLHSPKFNVFCAVSKKMVHGQILFAKSRVTGMTYLGLLENWLMPQLNEGSSD